MTDLSGKVKMRLEPTTFSDQVVESVVGDATNIILAKTAQKELNPALEIAVVNLSIIMLNQLGSEGLSSESYSGIAYQYMNELPSHIQSIVNANAKIGSWGDDEDESTTEEDFS